MNQDDRDTIWGCKLSIGAIAIYSIVSLILVPILQYFLTLIA